MNTMTSYGTGSRTLSSTLTRFLAEDGVSFRHIFDEVRRDFAYTLLQDRSLSIGDIAFFLQFSEPAASILRSGGGPVARHERSARPDRSHHIAAG
jgi:hypothetical protein